ncbi:cytochrome P450 2U1-like [Physella acuta]|uniref:cytochrome P450 2U1-like n=1 Tax=Physella acuta TaxID=109671 RepID=UPI0027DCC929|nr:cytochrome P450 2U1-like [Physella acuta]
MELAIVLGAVIVIIVGYIWWIRRHDRKLPPCPVRPLPVVGHLLSLDKDPREQYKRWRQQCGDIFSLYLGSNLMVVLNGYDLIADTLVRRGDLSSDRPRMFIDEASGLVGKGAAFSSGEVWREQRAITMRLLKQFGMGKNILAEKIQAEIECYLKTLSNLKGEATDIRSVTYASVSNIICSIVIGERFEYSDPKFQNLLQDVATIMKNLQMNSFLNFFPFLRFVPGDPFKGAETVKAISQVCGFAKDYVDRYSCESDSSYEHENFIAAYKAEKVRKQIHGETTTMDDANLIKIVYELFIAGSETTSLIITWCILYMVNHIKAQRKAYQEISDLIGTERAPNLNDKVQLPYLGAVIQETMRLANILPHSLSHAVNSDVEIYGYTIPKGTCISPNLDSIMHDESLWGDDVMSFRPERFLDDTGKLKNIPECVPYSVGRRLCLGESLANMEIFIYLASMFQRFEFRPSDSAHPPSMKHVFGFTVAPQPYKVRVIERNVRDT